MLQGFLRGNLVQWDESTSTWRYPDDGVDAMANPRPCPECKQLPTSDGHDPCVANIVGASGACCGHGVHLGYVNWEHVPADNNWWQGAFLIKSPHGEDAVAGQLIGATSLTKG